MIEFLHDNLGSVIAWVIVLIMVAIVGLPFYVMWRKGIIRSKF